MAERWKSLADAVAQALPLDAAGRTYLLASSFPDNEIRAQATALLDARPSHTPLTAGTVLGPYQVEAGGEAVDGRTGRPVTLWAVTAGRSQPATAMAASALQHPNIGEVLECGSAGEVDYVATERPAGVALTEVVRDRDSPLAERLELARQVAAALSAAHEAGLVHGGLAPGCIIASPDEQVKLLGFGLPRSAPLSYWSPEQALGLPLDQRSDIFSFGSILFELLTRRRAFDSAEPQLSLIASDAPDVRSLTPSVPPRVADLVAQCHRRDPAERPASMAEVRTELEAILNPVATMPPPRSRRALLAGLGMVAAAATAGVAYWRPFAPQPDFRLTYSLVTREKGEEFHYVPFDKVAQVADLHFQFHFQAEEPGWIYLVSDSLGGSDQPSLLFLNVRPLPKGQMVTSSWMRLPTPAVDTIWLVAARQPVAWLDSLPSGEIADPKQVGDLRNRLNSLRARPSLVETQRPGTLTVRGMGDGYAAMLRLQRR